MDEQLVRQHNEARQRASQLLEESRADGIDETRRAELIASATEALDEADRLRAEAEAHTRLGELAELRIERRELSPGPDANSDRMDVATAEDIRERHSAVQRRILGMDMSDEQRAASSRMFRAERLFPRRLAEILSGRDTRLTAQERAEWDAHAELMVRAIDGGQTTDDGEGGELVPDFLVPQIFAGRAAMGPMATEERLRVIRGQQLTAKHTLPTVTDNTQRKAKKIAEGTDVTGQKVATSSVVLDPNKYRAAIPVNSELLVGDYVGFEQWLTNDVGRWFGRMFNEERTTGDGSTGNLLGVAEGARKVSTETNTASFTVQDIMGLLSGLDSAYAANGVVQMHRDTIFKLLAMNRGTSGYPQFIVNPANALPILPGAPTVLENPDLKQKIAVSGAGTAGDKLVVFGDLSEYAVLMAGPMRVYREFFSISDQWLLTWYQSHDGRVITPDAFRVLQQKA